MKKLFTLLFILILANGVFANKQETQIKSYIVVLDDKCVLVDGSVFITFDKHLTIGETTYYPTPYVQGVKFIMITEEALTLFFTSGETFSFKSKPQRISSGDLEYSINLALY